MSSNKANKVRVAAYIRIGGTGEYAHTHEAQKQYFSKMAAQNQDWELVEVYADLGIDSRRQPNFGRLMADCRAGCIDLIVTKSAARISRSMNTLMNIVRELARLKPPVGVFFEDTKLNTLEKDNFLLLTMFEVMSLNEYDGKNGNAALTKHLKSLDKARKQKKGDEGNE